jgi:hypothetical protein
MLFKRKVAVVCWFGRVQPDRLCGGERVEVQVEWKTLDGRLTQRERLFFHTAHADGQGQILNRA